MRALHFILVVLGLSLATVARADEPAVTAVLNESETAVGRPVQLAIQVTGGTNPKPPAEISVEGLDIRSAGVSREYQMRNFSVSYSFTFNYTVLPTKPGVFKIPAQQVEVGGKTLRTPELTLNVVNSPGQSSRSSRGGNSAGGKFDSSQIGFLEAVLPKSVAYVGEMIPLQARLGVRTPIESFGSGIQIDGQGFTTEKFRDPRETSETVNGRNYRVFIFKTAISPARSGKIEVGPTEMNVIARVPRTGQRNPALPRDLFDDPFFNNFFNDPAFAPSMSMEVHLQAEPTTLEVKPLPPNAPKEFSGAVGTFSLSVDVNPKKAQAGDPLTVTAKIVGRGNFDRVTAPVLEDERGWHKYPPSDNFKQDDDVGISGTKTFEIVLSAKERKDKLPPFVFSFFDPVKETYVTLRSAEIPIAVEGGAAPSATPATAAAALPTVVPSATPAPTPKQEQDILYQLTDRPAHNESFTPIYERNSFWLAQLIPLLALLGLIGFKIRRARMGDRDAQRLARLEGETSEVRERLRREDAPDREYVADASRAVQLKTALARKIDPNGVDAEIAAAAFKLDDGQRRQLRELFQESDELRYSGGRNGGRSISPEKRREILDLVENLRA